MAAPLSGPVRMLSGRVGVLPRLLPKVALLAPLLGGPLLGGCQAETLPQSEPTAPGPTGTPTSPLGSAEPPASTPASTAPVPPPPSQTSPEETASATAEPPSTAPASSTAQPEPTATDVAPSQTATNGAGGAGGAPSPAPDTGGAGGSTAGGPTDAGTEPGAAGAGGGSEPEYEVLDPGTEGDGVLPEISGPYRDVNLEQRDVPRGQVYRFVMSSSDSTIYPGLNGAYTRNVDVYIPAQYVDGDEAPFIVVQDGTGYTGRMQRALDNLIGGGEAPALIAVMVDNGGGDAVGSQRGLEYDTLSDVYTRFVDSEVLPAVAAEPQISADYPNLKFTENPEGRAAMGCSSGAAAAFTMAWFGGDRYRRVLSYSGTFVDQQDPAVPTYPNGAWEYHEHLIAEQTPNKPIRVYLEVGENDLRADDPESTLHNWVLANQRMAEVLGEKGYHYQYQFARGAGHCDYGVIGQTLFDALKWLWRGYPLD